MTILIKIFFILTGVFYFSQSFAIAGEQIITDIKIIHASSTERNTMDPGLKPIVSEFRSVFRYTSYRILKEQTLNLSFNQKGRVNLPGKRTLGIMASGLTGKRIHYQIDIQKNGRPIFNTQVLLRNNSSITIGGPRFKDGVLLFNISASAR
jgi:hypothetical protein